MRRSGNRKHAGFSRLATAGISLRALPAEKLFMDAFIELYGVAGLKIRAATGFNQQRIAREQAFLHAVIQSAQQAVLPETTTFLYVPSNPLVLKPACNNSAPSTMRSVQAKTCQKCENSKPTEPRHVIIFLS